MVKIIPEGIGGIYSAAQLLEIMQALRSPEGCPWDREQTHKSIRNDAIEEIYEVVDAIDTEDKEALCEELGDVLLQVVFHAQIAKENGDFTFEDVVDGICKKLVLRHPHVFAEEQIETSGAVLDRWEAIKKQEKHQETATETLKSVPNAFPALMRAAKVQKRAIKAGATFENPIDNGELSKAVDALNTATTEEEKLAAYGKLLFLSASLQNFIKTNAEEALNRYTDGYIANFEENEKQGDI